MATKQPDYDRPCRPHPSWVAFGDPHFFEKPANCQCVGSNEKIHDPRLMKSPDPFPEAQTHGTQLHSKAQSHHHLTALILHWSTVKKSQPEDVHPTMGLIPGSTPYLPLEFGLSTTPVLTMMSMRLWVQSASKASPWTAKPQLSIRRSACPGWYADTLLIVTEKDRSLSAKTPIPVPRFHDVQKKQRLTNARLLGVKIVGRASLFSENHKAKDYFIIPKYSRILSGPITSAGCLTPEYPRLPG